MSASGYRVSCGQSAGWIPEKLCFTMHYSLYRRHVSGAFPQTSKLMFHLCGVGKQAGYGGLRHQHGCTDLFVQSHDTVRQGLIKDTCL